MIAHVYEGNQLMEVLDLSDNCFGYRAQCTSEMCGGCGGCLLMQAHFYNDGGYRFEYFDSLVDSERRIHPWKSRFIGLKTAFLEWISRWFPKDQTDNCCQRQSDKEIGNGIKND